MSTTFATKTAKICAGSTGVLLLLLLWAIASGPDGDLGFAILCVAVATSAFVIGAWAKRWWAALAMAALWFVGWMGAGTGITPDSYAAATAFVAPAVGLFAALGVGVGRGGARRPASG